MMDIVRIAQTGQSYLYTNVGNGSNWTQSAIGSSLSGTTSGVAAMDYDWDGAVDILVTKQSGSTYLIRNTNTVSYGTSLHLHIVDGSGINDYYGNTVQLYNSAGVLVASQIINPQSGMGVNDISAIVNFYGLSASDTYSAVLVNTINNVSSNISSTVNASWGGLKPPTLRTLMISARNRERRAATVNLLVRAITIPSSPRRERTSMTAPAAGPTPPVLAHGRRRAGWMWSISVWRPLGLPSI